MSVFNVQNPMGFAGGPDTVYEDHQTDPYAFHKYAVGAQQAQQGIDLQRRQQDLQNQQFGQSQGQQNRQFTQGQAQQAALTRQQYATQLANTRLPLQYQQAWRNKIFPMVQRTFQGFSGQPGGGFAFGAPGGQSGAGPHITAGPIWDAGTLQGEINSQRAQNDMATQGQIHAMQQQMAGQGYGANSPLAALLMATYQGQNQGTNAKMATDMRYNAAQGNAQQLLKGQTAQEQQYSNRMQEDIERRRLALGGYQTDQQTRASLLSALSQFA